MKLSHEAVTSFQRLYKDKCGVSLGDEEAHALALKELKRFSLIYKPIPIADQKFYNKLNNEINNK